MIKTTYHNELLETYGSDDMFRDAGLDEWLYRYLVWGGPMLNSIRYGQSPEKRKCITTGNFFYRFEKGVLCVRKRGSNSIITKISKRYLKHKILDYKAKCVMLIDYISVFIHRDNANDGEECISCGFVGRCHEHHDPPVTETARKWLYTRTHVFLLNILKKGVIGDAHRRFVGHYYQEINGNTIKLCDKCHIKRRKRRDPDIEQQWKIFLEDINGIITNTKEKKASLWDFL